ncbi:MAG: aldo/keto reductase [Phenylobacterium sp.]|nr:aldo/keto reductase [Phenylobacterium sp.]
MEYTRLGSTGLQVSRLCLGAMSFGTTADWMIPEDESLAIVKRAFDAGINFFDTADVYSRGESETILGKALKQFGRREQFVVATKVYNPMGSGPNQGGLSRKHIMHSIDASLTRLGVDYVDLYQIHRYDYHTPIEETIEALDEVVKSGKALYIGGSTMLAYQMSRYLHLADKLGATRFATMQNQYNLLFREEEREMNPLCVEEGVGLIPWSPLAAGALAGSKGSGSVRSQSPMGGGRYNSEADDAIITAVKQVAEQRGEKPAQVAIAWLLSKPGVSAPIIGATKLHQLDDPVAAVGKPLSEEEIGLLEKAYVPRKTDRTLARPWGPAPGAPRKA